MLLLDLSADSGQHRGGQGTKDWLQCLTFGLRPLTKHRTVLFPRPFWDRDTPKSIPVSSIAKRE